MIENEFKKPLGKGKYIFLNSCFDMFAEPIPDEMIKKVLTHCIANPDNTYLLQTKNPKRMYWYYQHSWMGNNYVYGTTIETNSKGLSLRYSNAPIPEIRKNWMTKFSDLAKTMVSIEPILDFDLEVMTKWMKEINPRYISIGADSKGHNLPEPSWEKVQTLIEELKKHTQVKVKSNLNRLKK